MSPSRFPSRTPTSVPPPGVSVCGAANVPAGLWRWNEIVLLPLRAGCEIGAVPREDVVEPVMIEIGDEHAGRCGRRRVKGVRALERPVPPAREDEHVARRHDDDVDNPVAVELTGGHRERAGGAVAHGRSEARERGARGLDPWFPSGMNMVWPSLGGEPASCPVPLLPGPAVGILDAEHLLAASDRRIVPNSKLHRADMANYHHGAGL